MYYCVCVIMQMKLTFGSSAYVWGRNVRMSSRQLLVFDLDLCPPCPWLCRLLAGGGWRKRKLLLLLRLLIKYILVCGCRLITAGIRRVCVSYCSLYYSGWVYVWRVGSFFVCVLFICVCGLATF